MLDRIEEYIETFSPTCEECGGILMNFISKDRRSVSCPNCWTSKPVPLTHLGISAKLDEVKRLKTLAAQREAILA